MYQGKRFLAIIPARGGSKRLPRKNVLSLAGKPLIAWTIEAAQKSKYLDRIVVSTDDDEICKVASRWNAEVIDRPADLASDTATSVDVVLHVLQSIDQTYDYIVLLQPTSPLRTEAHIDEAIELLHAKQANAVISVCETEHSPLWCNTLPADGSMENFIRPEVQGKRSQDLPTYYRMNGAVYISCYAGVEQSNFLVSATTYAYTMDALCSVDIDTPFDFSVAECLCNVVI